MNDRFAFTPKHPALDLPFHEKIECDKDGGFITPPPGVALSDALVFLVNVYSLSTSTSFLFSLFPQCSPQNTVLVLLIFLLANISFFEKAIAQGVHYWGITTWGINYNNELTERLLLTRSACRDQIPVSSFWIISTRNYYSQRRVESWLRDG